MTSDLLFTIMRLGYLVLLWCITLGAVSLLRRDIFGTVVTPRGKGRERRDAQLKESRRHNRRGTTPPQPRSLLITGGPLVGQSLTLGVAPIVIGRSPSSTLVLDDEYVSSTHARLFLDGQQWCIEDLHSTNGTIVDDERLVDPRPLALGDTIRIGQSTLELVG